MYFLVIFVLCWVWFWMSAEKSRIRELFGTVVYTSFLGLFTDLIMVHYKLWSYEGLPAPLFTVPLSLDFGIYPVVAYLFVQHLPKTWVAILMKTLRWTCFSVLFEWVTLRSGSMHHHMWWSLWCSLGSDILIFLSIAAVYRYYSPVYQTAKASR